MKNQKKDTKLKKEKEAYEKLPEEEKNGRAQNIQDILFNELDYELRKRHVYPENLELFHKIKIITIDKYE